MTRTRKASMRTLGAMAALLVSCGAGTAASALPAGVGAEGGAPAGGAPAAFLPADHDDEDSPHKVVGTAYLLAGWTIAIDPGHNGGNADNPEETSRTVSDGRGGFKPCNTVGTTSLDDQAEHEFTFAVATGLTEQLEAMGATVVLTRTDDTGVGPCVDVRGRFAEDVDADFMLSLHANGSTDPADEGFFAIVSDPALSDSQEAPSVELALTMIEALTEAGLTPSNSVDGALSERADLATLNFARRPAVMLELGEMRNAADSARMASEEGRELYVDALTAGVLDWTQSHPSAG